MNFFRWMVGLPLAAAVTAILFFVMATLIAQQIQFVEGPDTPKINILAKPEPPPTTKPRPPDVLPEAPPPPDTRRRDKVDAVGRVPFSEPDPIESGSIDLTGGGAVITIPPVYPENCRARQAEGQVVVQFDVTDRGEVTNARIVSSDHPCFNRTVIKTVLGWKYSPGAQQYGMIETFSFTLTE